MLDGRTGHVEALGVGYTRSLTGAPNMPTIAETVPAFNNTGWRARVAPPGTPQPIILKLNVAINKGQANVAPEIPAVHACAGSACHR